MSEEIDYEENRMRCDETKFDKTFGPTIHPYNKIITGAYKVAAIPIPAGKEGYGHADNPLTYNDWAKNLFGSSSENNGWSIIFQSIFQIWLGLIEQTELGTPLLRYDKVRHADTPNDIQKLLKDKKGKPIPYNLTTTTKPEGSHSFECRVAAHIRSVYDGGSNLDCDDVRLLQSTPTTLVDHSFQPLPPRSPPLSTTTSGNISNTNSVHNMEENEDDTSENNNNITVTSGIVKNEEDINITDNSGNNNNNNTGIVDAMLSMADVRNRQQNSNQSIYMSTSSAIAAAANTRRRRGRINKKYEEKVKIVIHKLMKKDNPKEYAGMIVFFIQMDPNWNAGRGIDNLCDYKTKIRLPVRNKPLPYHVIDRYEKLAEHNFLYQITPEEYGKLCSAYVDAVDVIIDDKKRKERQRLALLQPNIAAIDNINRLLTQRGDTNIQSFNISDDDSSEDETTASNNSMEEENSMMLSLEISDDEDDDDLYEEGKNECSNKSFAMETHPFHPVTVFDPILAYKWMDALGADVSKCHNFITAGSDGRYTVQFDGENSWRIEKQYFFWDRKEKHGLKDCYLPWATIPFIPPDYHDNNNDDVTTNNSLAIVSSSPSNSAKRRHANRKENSLRRLQSSSFMRAHAKARNINIDDISFGSYGKPRQREQRENLSLTTTGQSILAPARPLHSQLSRQGRLNWVIALSEKSHDYFKLVQSFRPDQEVNFQDPTSVTQYNQYVAKRQGYELNVGHYFDKEIWTKPAIAPVALLHLIEYHRGKGGLRRVSKMIHLYREDMDHYANWMLLNANVSRFDRRVATNVRDWILTHYGAKDCYRHSFQIHWNWACTGPAGCSKSYMLEDLIKLSVPGSIDNIINATPKADNVDADVSDSTTVYDEAPVYIMRSGEHDNAAQGASNKAKISGGQLKMKVFEFVDTITGKKRRTSRVVITNCIGTILLATNMTFSNMDKAMATRFHRSIFTHWVIKCRKDKKSNAAATADATTINNSQQENDISNIDNDEIVSEREEEEDKEEADEQDIIKKASVFELNSIHWNSFDTQRIQGQQSFFRIKQVLIAMANKMIQINVLPEPNMETCHHVTNNMLNYMSRVGKIKVGSFRSYQRILAWARVATIDNAINTVFNSPGAPLYGKEFEVKHMLELKPHLCCSVQIAVWAFTLHSDEYLNQTLGDIFKTAVKITNYPIEKRAKAIRENKKIEEPEETYQLDTTREINWREVEVTSSSSAVANNHLSSPPPPQQQQQQSSPQSIYPQRSAPMYGNGGAPYKKLDLNYVTIRGTQTEVARKIRAYISPTPSIEDIKSLLTNLKEHSIEVEHARNPCTEDEIITSSRSSQQQRTGRKILNVIEQTKSIRDGEQWHFCINAIDTVVSDKLIERAVQSLSYDGWLPRTLLLGIVEDAYRGTFKTIKVNADNSKKGFKVFSAAYMTSEERSMLYMASNWDPNVIQNDKDAYFDYDMSLEEINKMLDKNRTSQYMTIDQDLDDWAMRRHCEQTGVPLAADEQDGGKVKWKHTNPVTGCIELKDLPTPAAEKKRMMKFIRGRKTVRDKHNACYNYSNNNNNNNNTVTTTTTINNTIVTDERENSFNDISINTTDIITDTNEFTHNQSFTQLNESMDQLNLQTTVVAASVNNASAAIDNPVNSSNSDPRLLGVVGGGGEDEEITEHNNRTIPDPSMFQQFRRDQGENNQRSLTSSNSGGDTNNANYKFRQQQIQNVLNSHPTAKRRRIQTDDLIPTITTITPF